MAFWSSAVGSTRSHERCSPARRRPEARTARAAVVHIRNNGGGNDPDAPGTTGWELVHDVHSGEHVVDKREPDAFAKPRSLRCGAGMPSRSSGGPTAPTTAMPPRSRLKSASKTNCEWRARTSSVPTNLSSDSRSPVFARAFQRGTNAAGLPSSGSAHAETVPGSRRIPGRHDRGPHDLRRPRRRTVGHCPRLARRRSRGVAAIDEIPCVAQSELVRLPRPLLA